MPEAVTRYKTFDGKMFADEQAAEKWERSTNRANAIKSMFPNSGHLSSGDFYRLPMQLIADARREFVVILKEIMPSYEDAIRYFENGGRHGTVGRVLDDSDSQYSKVMWLFDTIDDQGRMFNQPYYADHPEEARDEVSY